MKLENMGMRRQSIKNQVYEGLLSDILNGLYTTDMVINEKEIVEKYQVSKTPVREALVQLCSEDIIVNVPRFGYQVKSILPLEIIELVDYRKIIELSSLERSFSCIGANEIVELKQLNAEAKEIALLKDTKTHWKKNVEFHKRLCSYSGNRYLQKSLNSILNVCTCVAYQFFMKLWTESRPSDALNHVHLVQAIEENNLPLAKRILQEDVESFKEEIL